MRHFLKIHLWGLFTLFIGFFAFPAAATTYYVDINSPNPTPPYTNWTTASTDIQSAVNLSTNGDLVLVNPGVYQSGGYMAPDGTLSTVVISNSVTLQSVNGPSTTFINGNNAMRGIYLQNTSMLVGFTITNSTSGNNDGGGVYCQTASQTVSNCVIVGNATSGADVGGGGVFSGALYNCLIISNSAPGGNGGGNKFGILNNCIIAGNNAAYGGGCFQSAIINCTLDGNYASSAGGGMYNANAANSTIENCIIYDNICNNGANWFGGTYNYCCTIPLPGGTGNITSNPLFVNETAGDFQLQSNSPCVNAGNNGYITTTNDFAENPRIVDGIVDMGAYEYQGLLPLTLSIEAATNIGTGTPLPMQAVVGNGSASTTSWDFGDGSMTTNVLSVSHSWSLPGIYTVTLTATISATNNFDVTNSITNTVATLVINVVSQPISYVNVNGSNPVPPYASWNTAATNIQDAVNAGYYDGTILVTNGVYQSGGYTAPDGNLSCVVVSNAVTLQSVNGPGFTFIQGYQPTNIFNLNNGVRCVYMTTYATLSGFTLTGGAASYGGGIYCQSTACLVSNCIIAGNSVVYSGGGAYSGTLENCVLTNNSTYFYDYSTSGGGGTYNSAVFNSLIVANYSSGLGAGANRGTLVNCTLLNNFTYEDGGGAADAFIYGSLVISNVAGTGIDGDVYDGAGGGVYDCTNFNSAIADNMVFYGNGGGADQSTLINCTITGNSSYNGGGTYSCIQTNCIIYFNQASSGSSNYSGGSFNFCCATPNPGYKGCISSPPALANISHISLNSPCRGAGNPAVTSGTDIDGNSWANPPSIGCSEPYPGNDFGNLTVGISVPFTNQAPGYPIGFQTSISGPVFNSIWNFGDGTLVTNEAYISHAWAANGSYPVTLTAYNDSYPTGVTATLLISIAVPSVYYVNLNNLNPSPPYSHWSTAAVDIQDAISVAPAGSLILVTNGPSAYNTNTVAIYQSGGIAVLGNTYSVAITNPVTVQSVVGPAVTYIAGGGHDNCVYMCNGSTLSGFTITNNYNNNSGITAASVNAIITNCVITHCGGTAVSLGTLYNCKLVANSNPTGVGGAANESTMFNCVISNNYAGAGGGAVGGILNNCLIVSNTAGYGGGVYCQSGYPVELNNCLISNNTAQYGGGVFNATSFTNCILSNCTVTRNSASQYYGGGALNAQLNNCLISRNSANYGGGVCGGILNNCVIISNSASDGGGVFAGTALNYNPTLSCPAMLNNCMISNNVATFGGGGLYNSYLSVTNCILSNCTLTLNSAYYYGGGADNARLDNCLISSNQVITTSGSFCGGGGVEYGALNNCTLIGNSTKVSGGGADGSDLEIRQPNTFLTNCLLIGNVAPQGGGANDSVLVNCTVIGNSATNNGGGVALSILNNCLVISNSAQVSGGGAYGAKLVNCTLTANSAVNGGGAYNCTNYNSILYYNINGDYYPSTLQYPLNYCCTALMPTNGFRNITYAPLFVNAAASNFQLQPTSPCINSGNNAYVSTPTDLAGNPRIVGGTVDIGAYEYQSPTSVISYAYLQQYGLPTDGSVDFADLDGTAFSVYQDWVAGLNPTNSASVLAMLTPTATNNANCITVTWQSVSGISYNLLRSTNLPAFTTIQSSITGQTNTTSYTDTSATNNFSYFYRVSVLAP